MRNSNCDEEESTAFLATEDDGSEDDTPLVLRVKTMGRGSSEGQYRIECVACPVLALLLVRTLFERASSSRIGGAPLLPPAGPPRSHGRRRNNHHVNNN